MHSSSIRSYPKLRNFLRQFRLQIVVSITGISNWNAKIEQPKVALYQNRSVALVHSLLHLISLGGAFALLILQWTNHLVGFDFPKNGSTTLQFVSKLHELLMQGSLVEIFLYLVRNESIYRSVPFGVLSGALQATQLSYLWSLDFMSIFGSSVLKGWRRLMFAVAIPVLSILISLVGPSSAVLMIPRPSSRRARPSVTRYLRNSTEAMYPSVIGVAEGLRL
jgi:hypothetical protein